MSKTAQVCCLCEGPSPDYKVPASCAHKICKGCFKKFQEQAAQSKKPTYTLHCPHEKCTAKIHLNELMQIVSLPNNCRRCGKDAAYTCNPCLLKEIEEVAKINYYSKHLRFDELVPIASIIDELQKLELICPICRDFNQMPVIACQQGHEICRDCFYNIRSHEDIKQCCPLCKCDLLPLPPQNLRTLSLIKNLDIQCHTCNKKVKYQEFITHHYRSCCENKILCDECNEQVELKFFDIHQSNYCLGARCPFNCDRKLVDHKHNFMIEHLISTMRQSDVTQTFMLRLQIFDKFLFYGSFGSCQACDSSYAWQVDNRGVQETFCFTCFRLS